MLHGPLRSHGYDWWWHSFTAQDAETGEDKPFFIEFFLCNPALAEDEPVLGQLPANREAGKKPSYLMVKAGTWGENHCQLHRFFAWKDVSLHGDAPYRIEAGIGWLIMRRRNTPTWICGSRSSTRRALSGGKR